MIRVRRSEDRGHADYGWLDTYHTFSFADYYDPEFMGFRGLRVINEDKVSAGRGFPTHPHRDMEIITYVVEGALEHKDTLGTSAQVLPGEVQCMSAGTGIQHSEFNPRKDRSTHLLQIWILPTKTGVKPSYGQKSFADQLNDEDLVKVVSPNGEDGSIALNQDNTLYAAKWTSAREKSFTLPDKHYGWIQLIKGDLEVSGQKLSAGDGAAIVEEKNILIRSSKGAEFLLFDLK